MDQGHLPPPGFLGHPQTSPCHPDDWSQPSLSERIDEELARLRDLACYATGEVILTFPDSPGTTISVPGLNASLIEDRSPLLAVAFESSSSGLRLHLEALSPETVIPFIRFLYTPSYGLDNPWADVPTSVLLHCKMFHLGELYDITALKSQAYVNVLRQCEYGCSAPEKPIDLYKAISFAYSTLNDRSSLTDAIVQYCVTCCLYHKLHEDSEFKGLVFNIKAFNQDLVKVCMQRGYEDESAAIIIRLPYRPFAPDTFASTENPAMQDVIHHFHSTDRFDLESSPKKKQRVIPEDVHVISSKAVPTQLCEKRRQASKVSFRSATDTSIFSTPSKSSASDSITLPTRSLQSNTAISNESQTQYPAATQGIPIRSKAGQHEPISPSTPQLLRSDTTTPQLRQNMMALQTILCTGLDVEGGLPETQPRTLAEDREASIKASSGRMKIFNNTAGSYDFQKQPVSETKKRESTIFNGNQLPAASRSVQVVASARPTQQRKDSFVQVPATTAEGLPSTAVQTSKANADERAGDPAFNGRNFIGRPCRTNAGSFAPSNASPTLPAFEPYRTARSGISPPIVNVSSSAYATPGGAAEDSATNKATCEPNYALQDYMMQLMLLEQQNKNRKFMAKVGQEAMKCSPPREETKSPTDALSSWRDWQHAWKRELEDMNKKRLLMAREESDGQILSPEGARPHINGEPTRQYSEKELTYLAHFDYRYQSMLVDVKKKRRLMEKQEKESRMSPVEAPVAHRKQRAPDEFDERPNLQECREQLASLEAQGKIRCKLMTRQESFAPEAAASPETAIALNPREKIGFDAFPGRGICRFVCLPDPNGKCTDCGSTELERDTYLQKQNRIQSDHFANFDHGVSRAAEHIQGLNFEFPSRGDDPLDSFDFETFLNPDAGSFDHGFSTSDISAGSNVRTPKLAANAEAKYQANATGDLVESDIDMCNSDADSDASWVDVDMKPTQVTTCAANQSTAAAAAAAAATSTTTTVGPTPISTSAKRSSATFEENDDEWDLC